ncbi:hypothetical protein D3C85_1592410 [compost metagenome]
MTGGGTELLQEQHVLDEIRTSTGNIEGAGHTLLVMCPAIALHVSLVQITTLFDPPLDGWVAFDQIAFSEPAGAKDAFR